MSEPQKNTGKKKIKLHKMLSDEAAAEMAQNTWNASATGQEENRRLEEQQRRWANPEIGDKMSDGTIYAGLSPDTGKQMFATAEDAPISMDFNAAAKYAKKLDAHGHKDWRVPSKAELQVLFENREKGALKGTFNLTGSDPAGWYWSSSPSTASTAWCQRFSDGNQNVVYRGTDLSVRCVR